MPLDPDAIMRSLEIAAERGIDPTPLVYARLFAAHPETEALFILGPAAKGHMLDEAFRLILDYLGPRTYASGFLKSTRLNHEDLGVDPTIYADLFSALADALKEIAGPDWTPEFETAWTALNAELAALAAG